MISTLFYLYALSALHLGTGQGTGIIDLPIAREKATNLPFVPGASIKGVLREEMRPENGAAILRWEALFGPASVTDDSGFAGALAIGDAHLFCLPVRSLAGTFAWATCPFILMRFKREANAVDVATPDLPTNNMDDSALITAESKLIHGEKVVLEDLDLSVQAGANEWGFFIASEIFPEDMTWQTLFKERFVILADGVFDFLAETATEVRARIRINQETRTVAKGALWYEENLPAETMLYGIVGANRARKGSGTAEEMMNELPSNLRLQLGGSATIGRGIVNWIRKEV